MATAMKMTHPVDGARILLNVSPEEADFLAQLIGYCSPAVTHPIGITDESMLGLLDAFVSVGIQQSDYELNIELAK